MKVEIISVGTELLLGNIVNTNGAYLADKCALLGFTNYYQTVVGDNFERLLKTLETASERSDILLLTGGLGPTQDDLTKEVVAAFLKKELVLHEESKNQIIQIFQRRNREITDNNWKQAMMIKDSIVVDNPNGTAPGLICKKENIHIILMPGPPSEMIPMFEERIIPYLKQLTDGIIYSKTIKLCGIGESQAETMILDLLEKQSNPTIAPYAKTSEVHFRLTAKAKNEEEAEFLLKPFVKEFQKRFHSFIYTMEESVTLEEEVLRLLRSKNKKLLAVESCTGGMLSAKLVGVEGASDVFYGSMVTYANQAKEQFLMIDSDLLKEKGAVSKEVSYALAENACKISGCEVSISITGIAGPTGGTKEKPVGLVYMACCIDHKVEVVAFQFTGNRNRIRENAVANALIFLRTCLLKSELKS